MRHICLILFLILGAAVAPLVSAADENNVDLPKKGKELAPVSAVLAEARYLTKRKPNLKAQYYAFIRSASWCVPCKIFVPPVMKDYGRMRGAKVELIFLGMEEESVVKNYVSEDRYKCPVVLASELGSVPGLKFEAGLPRMCIVDAAGNFVFEAGGKYMQDWKKSLFAFQQEQRKLKAKEKASQKAQD